MARRSYKGNVQATTVLSGITALDASLTLVDGSSFPVGTNPFIVTINAGRTGEEKILVTSRTGNTLNGLTRGYDGTTASAHTAGESVQHTISAVDMDEANSHVNASSGVHGRTGAVVGTTDTQTLTNKTLTTPTIGSFVNAQHDHDDAAGGGVLASMGGLLTAVESSAGGGITTSSATPADIDSGALTVTFTVPSSGAVVVSMSAAADGGGAGTYRWTLTAAGTELAFGSPRMQISGAAGIFGHTYRRRFTGLTPGASLTWRWAHMVTSGTATFYASETATMEVWSA